MTLGWFIPVTVPVAGLSFNETARIAQTSFDTGGADLAKVPNAEFAAVLQAPTAFFPGELFRRTQWDRSVTNRSEGSPTLPTATEGHLSAIMMVGRVRRETAASVLVLRWVSVAREPVTAYSGKG